jgi:hypothetical protein
MTAKQRADLLDLIKELMAAGKVDEARMVRSLL